SLAASRTLRFRSASGCGRSRCRGEPPVSWTGARCNSCAWPAGRRAEPVRAASVEGGGEEMAIYLRQVCLVAARLEPVTEALSQVFSIPVCHVDPAVSAFGLENCILAV